MDPVTHLAGGLLVGRMLAPDAAMRHRAMAVGASAGWFPDVDYLARLIFDPLTALNLHRGLTHSELLAPLWAFLLGWVLARLTGLRFRRAWAIALAGIMLHVLLDLITPFGTRILAPLDDTAHTLGTTFVVDPWLTTILAVGVWLTMRSGRRAVGVAALGGVVLLVGFQWTQKGRAEAAATRWAVQQGLEGVSVTALPQPFSAWNWKLVVATETAYHIAYIHLGEHQGWLTQHYPSHWPLADTLREYRPLRRAEWHRVDRFGPDAQRWTARSAWFSPELAPLRRFARLPSWLGADPATGCVWFTDQRFVLPGLRPPFRFAACPAPGGWSLLRSHEDRAPAS